jgi:hypothetical protein
MVTTLKRPAGRVSKTRRPWGRSRPTHVHASRAHTRAYARERQLG